MIEASHKAIAYAKNRTREDIENDEILRFALVKIIEIIGEAAAKISRPFQVAHPEIPWAQIIAMRNRLVHAYFDINLDILWQTIEIDLPELIVELENLLAEL
jgi:uncharacterized protein with HEPN domain